MTAKFNLPDAILLFLYADYNNRITGMSRLAACAYFLEAEIGLVAKRHGEDWQRRARHFQLGG